MNDSEHLHLAVRHENGVIEGDFRHRTADEIESMLNGTPYRDDPELWDVIIGKLERGYCVNPRSWVAVTRCSGTSDEECVQAGTSIVIGGDIRLKKRLEGP
jgi:hypothetical protein